jgi:hypothetical protein
MFNIKCQNIFEWAGYRPHTIFHRNRFPLIGKWNAWQHLNDRLTVELQGRMPTAGNNQTSEHVIDVIIFQDQKVSSLNLVKTDMYTIVFVDKQSPIPVAAVRDWYIRLKQINGSIVFIDYQESLSEQASDDLNTNETSISNTYHGLNLVRPRFDVVHLIRDRNIISNGIDVLSVIFQDIGNVLSEYQEQKIRDLMKQCNALIYNEDLRRDDAPDGYYLCDANCLKHLEYIFHRAPHTFATRDLLRIEASAEQHILLTVEVKVSLDSLQCKLNMTDYYILHPAPNPIRHLVIVNGGQITRTWLYLINLAHVDSTNRTTRIDQDIHARSRQFAMRLRSGHTHIVYMSSFSSETFRQEPLTENRLAYLCELVSGSAKLRLDNEQNEKKKTCLKEMINLLDRFMEQHPIRKERSSMNFSILQQVDAHTNRSFCFLEELALSLLEEMQANVSQANQNVRLPQQLIERAHKLRTVRPASVIVVPEIRIRPPSACQASLPSDSDDDNDDNMKYAEQST